MWSMAGSVGAATGPSLSALVISMSWRGVYLLGVPVLVAIIVLAPGRLTESSDGGTGSRLDWFGGAAGTLGVGGIVFAVTQSRAWGWSNPWVVSTLLGAVVLLPLFVLRSLHHSDPLLDVRVFRTRTVWSANLTNLFLSMAGNSIWLVWPLFLGGIWGWSPLRIGLAITPGPVNAGIFAVVAGRLLSKVGPRRLVSIGCLFPVAALVFFYLVPGEEPNYWTGFLPGVLLFSTGFGLTFSPLNAAALEDVPEAKFGQVNAAFNTLRNVAGAFGAAAVIALLGSRATSDLAAFDRTYAFLALCTVLAALTVLTTYPKHGRS